MSSPAQHEDLDLRLSSLSGWRSRRRARQELRRRPGSVLRLGLTALLAFLAAGCAAVRPWSNPPLGAAERVTYDGEAQVFDPSRRPELLVIANFSGGGSRSAAFAYAVVSELENLPFPLAGRQTTLAREIDVVTGVSGGAVTAAHLALFGLPEHLARFPDEFLRIDFQRRLVHSLIGHPWRAASPWYGRGHLLATELDARLFAGKTFGDLAALPRRPYLIVAATDLSSGFEFDFTAEQLGLLCTSIDRVPLSFAVASSSAVPALFSPLTLESHGDCRRAQPPPPAGADLPAGRRFLHLVDGGVSDDLGTHRIASFVERAGGIGGLFARLAEQAATEGGPPPPLRIVFLSVNSERRAGLEIDQKGEVPGAVEVINAMLYSGLGRQTREAEQIFTAQVAEWRRQLAADPRFRPRDGVAPADIFNIEIRLDGLLDDAPELKRRVLAIPTAFKLSEEDFELLRLAAAHSLHNSAEMQRLLRSTAAS